jgi:hypothetical protein
LIAAIECRDPDFKRQFEEHGVKKGAASRGDQRGTKPQLEAACVDRRIERTLIFS